MELRQIALEVARILQDAGKHALNDQMNPHDMRKLEVSEDCFHFTSDTDKRLQQVDFTDPYCNVNQSITVRSDSGITDVAQLEGKKIGAQSGTTGYEWAAENIKDAEVTGYDEMTAVFAALDSGQIDAVSVDLPVANYYVRSYSDCQVIKEIPTGEQYAVAVSKENPELTKALNKALQAVHDNGKYDELAAKWLQ